MQAPESAPVPYELASAMPEAELPPLVALAMRYPKPEDQWAALANLVELDEDPMLCMRPVHWRVALRRASEKASRGLRPRNAKLDAYAGTWKYEMILRVEAM